MPDHQLQTLAPSIFIDIQTVDQSRATDGLIGADIWVYIEGYGIQHLGAPVRLQEQPQMPPHNQPLLGLRGLVMEARLAQALPPGTAIAECRRQLPSEL